MALGLARMLRHRVAVELRPPLPRREPDRVLAALARDALDVAARLPLHPARRQPPGERRRDANLMTTMGLGGLWHGASLNFVVWGLYHGVLLVGTHHLARLAVPPAARGRGARHVRARDVRLGLLPPALGRGDRAHDRRARRSARARRVPRHGSRCSSRSRAPGAGRRTRSARGASTRSACCAPRASRRSSRSASRPSTPATPSSTSASDEAARRLRRRRRAPSRRSGRPRLVDRPVRLVHEDGRGRRRAPLRLLCSRRSSSGRSTARTSSRSSSAARRARS